MNEIAIVILRDKTDCEKWYVEEFNICVFFFQAEDGIRDIGVTGVQTCALPISLNSPSRVGSSITSGAGLDVDASGAELDSSSDDVGELASTPPASGLSDCAPHPEKVSRRARSRPPVDRNRIVPPLVGTAQAWVRASRRSSGRVLRSR